MISIRNPECECTIVNVLSAIFCLAIYVSIILSVTVLCTTDDLKEASHDNKTFNYSNSNNKFIVFL